MDKVLYMLIGPKGSGKTTIGALVDEHTDIAFIRVEAIWLSLLPDEDGWKKIEAVIDAMFETHDRLMIESLGAGDGFRRFYSALASKYSIKMVHVWADLDTCMARVRSRSSHDHIAVSDDKVQEYNRIAADVTFDWDLEIDNTGPKPDADIVAAIRSL